MENTSQRDSQQINIQGLIDRYLKVHSPGGIPEKARGFHLDDDSLSAFAEGNLCERETLPIVSHLVDCSFCRHITAELVRLDLAFTENDAINPVAENREPTKVSEVISGLWSRFGTSDDAVFAHNKTNEDDADEVKPKE